ncbi:Na(+)-translocating NADH-quinone reductase subunit [Trichinella pseudospiralis]
MWGGIKANNSELDSQSEILQIEMIRGEEPTQELQGSRPLANCQNCSIKGKIIDLCIFITFLEVRFNETSLSMFSLIE